jgi:hypothetical protein
MKPKGRKLKYYVVGGLFELLYLSDKNRWVLFGHDPWYIKSKTSPQRCFNTSNKAFSELRKLAELGFDPQVLVYEWNKSKNKFIPNKIWRYNKDYPKKKFAADTYKDGIVLY